MNQPASQPANSFPTQRQTGLLESVCFRLEPMLFPDPDDDGQAAVVWKEEEYTDALCFMLRASKKWKLPTLLFDVGDTVNFLELAFETHYKEIGRPCRGTTQENLRKGYFRGVAEQRVECILEVLAAGSQPYKLDFTDSDTVEILNPMAWDTAVSVESKGRKSLYHDMQPEFETQGVVFPPQEAAWQIASIFKPLKKTPRQHPPRNARRFRRNLRRHLALLAQALQPLILLSSVQFWQNAWTLESPRSHRRKPACILAAA
jgi:hypothetical protein